MTQSDFWLYQWLDSYLVKTPEQALRLLKQPSAREVLRQTAAEAADDSRTIDLGAGQSIIAGAGLDLSGLLDCVHWECIKKQVDSLFNSVWHYFDNVVVVGPSARYISSAWKATKPDDAWINYTLYNYIRSLLYIRNIGAEDLLTFSEKPHAFCDHHFTVLLNEIGVKSTDDYEQYVEELAQEISNNSKFNITIDSTANQVTATYNAPQLFDDLMVRTLDLKSALSKPKKKLRLDVARKLASNHVVYLLSDISAAQHLRVPLGATNKLHRHILRATNHEITEAEVAFNIQLPILHGVEARGSL